MRLLLKLICLMFLIPSICFGGTYKGLSEIIDLRTYRQKVYIDENDKKVYKIHLKDLHYKEGGIFKDINTTLIFDSNTRQYKHTKASYHPKLPEYADGWFEFYNAYEGTNHTIKAKPIASHVLGIPQGGIDLHDGLGKNVIKYQDAFGKGIDLKVSAYWGGLRKVICINKKPDDTSKDIYFDFELDLPVNVDIVKPDSTKWTPSTQALDFKNKTLLIGSDGKFSYFKNALVWDSGNKLTEGIGYNPVDIELYLLNGKTYLRKTIRKEYLEKAIYPLFTDHPTNYYSGAGDGRVHFNDASWNTSHDSSTGVASYTTTTSNAAATGKDGSAQSFVFRAFYPIDTSGIDDGATITDATLNLYAVSKLNGDNDGDDWLSVVSTTQAGTSELVTGDFDQCGDTIDNPTEGSDRIDIGNISTGQYNIWTLDATGIGWIDKTGVTKIGMREGHDQIDSPYAGANNTFNAVEVRMSEFANTASDPFLEVTTGVVGETAAQVIMF